MGGDREPSDPKVRQYLRIRDAMTSGDCEGCGGCCGRIIPMTKRERARLVEYARTHRLDARRHEARPGAGRPMDCALLDPDTNRCRAYAARPLVCRAWARPGEGELVGTTDTQPCGMRADMVRTFCAHLDEYQSTDTWELLGIRG